jgi:hypothetical protein
MSETKALEVCDYCGKQADDFDRHYDIDRIAGIPQDVVERVKTIISEKQGHEPDDIPKLCAECFNDLVFAPKG